MVLSKKSGNSPQTTIIDWLAHKHPKKREKENALSPQEMRDLQRAVTLSQREYSINKYNRKIPDLVDSQDEDDDFQSLVRSRPLLFDHRRQPKRKTQEPSKVAPREYAEQQQQAKVSVQVKQERPQRVIEIDELEITAKIKTEKAVLTLDIDNLFSADDCSSSSSSINLGENEETVPSIKEECNAAVKRPTFEIEDLFSADEQDYEPISGTNYYGTVPSPSRKGKERQQPAIVPSMAIMPSPPASTPERPVCPLCDQEFPLAVIEQHASECTGRISPSPRPRQRRRLFQRKQEPEPISDDDVIAIDELPRTQPSPSRQHRRRRPHVAPGLMTTADLVADIDIFTDEDEDGRVESNQDFRTCPLCHDWIVAKDLEAHVNVELERMESTVPSTGASSSHDNFRSSTITAATGMIDQSRGQNSPEVVALSDDDGSSEYSVLDITADDDGYLSPLEGFVSLEQLRQQDPAYQRYFDQTSGTAPSSRTRAGRSGADMGNNPRRRRQSQTPKRGGRKKAFWKGRGRASKARKKKEK